MLVRERIIVLDDLERRDAALSLETLFGYVDALKGKGCTVLLIYNEEELSTNQGKEWRAVREKCLDAEINLRPTPADACGLGLSPACPDREPIVATAEAAGLTNIRIIQRIERLTDAFRKAIPGREPQQPCPNTSCAAWSSWPSCTTRTAFRTNRWRPSWKTGPGSAPISWATRCPATPPCWPCDAASPATPNCCPCCRTSCGITRSTRPA